MLRIFRQYPHFLSFCCLSAAFTVAGQTYYISLFIPHIQQELQLSHSFLGSLYAAATLSSSVLNPWLGKFYDRVSIQRFSLTMVLGITVGGLMLGFSHTITMLFISLFVLRFFGQSGLGMTSMVTAARNFFNDRGKALGVTSLGFPFSEMFFPVLTAVLLQSFGWRATTHAITGLLLFVYLPLSMWLLNRGRWPDPKLEQDRSRQENSPQRTSLVSWTVKDVMRDWRFYFFLGVGFIPPFLNTAIIFHQGALALSKGWAATVLPVGIFSYGLFRGISAIFIGPIIDRHSARALYGYHLIPTLAGLLILGFGNHPFSCGVAFGLLGLTVGMGGPVRSALWPEMYGLDHLGGINGVGAAFTVFSTAVGPAFVGFALDRGSQWPTLLVGGFILTAAMIVAGRWASATEKSHPPSTPSLAIEGNAQ